MQVIFDTDISSDADDVGAVAVLHALANQGKIDILGMMVSSGDPWSVPCLAALNTWFGRPDIPIGRVEGKRVYEPSAYTRDIASRFAYNSELTGNIPDAVTLYRRLLFEQPDKSVIIITVGHLTNLANLLQSGPDDISPLDGRTLIKQKIKQLVSMGGEFPSGKEYNFYQDPWSAKYAIDNWPTRVVFLGYETGLQVITGKSLKSASESSPVRLAFQKHNDFEGRPSWDQLAVLYAAELPINGTQAFSLSEPGVNKISKDGSNHWQQRLNGNHYYLSLRADANDVATKIDTLMLYQTGRH